MNVGSGMHLGKNIGHSPQEKKFIGQNDIQMLYSPSRIFFSSSTPRSCIHVYTVLVKETKIKPEFLRVQCYGVP